MSKGKKTLGISAIFPKLPWSRNDVLICFDMFLPSLQLTAKAPENQWLEDESPFGILYF